MYNIYMMGSRGSYLISAIALALVAGCTRPNPAVCCLDQADCSEIGITGDPRPCAVGLACVNHACELPKCSMTGCAVAAPVCNITTDVCEACTDTSQCTHFTDTQVCDSSSGGCVQCVTSSDCPTSAPVCEAAVCRGCKRDTECASAACGDDGACVDETAAVYLDPGGTDAGSCARSAPCRSVAYAISQTAPNRNHIVFGPGTYSGNTNVTPQSTTATSLVLHGGGANLNGTGDGTTLAFQIAATIRDLEINAPLAGTGLQLAAGTFLVERVTARQGAAIASYANATLRDVVVENAQTAVSLVSGQLVLDRVVIKNGTFGIHADSGSVDISNLLVFGTADVAVDLSNASGTVVFSTIADSGTDAGTGARAFKCSSTSSLITVRSTIVWAPGSVSRPAIEGCNMVNVIAGPTASLGASNVDPLFVNAIARDYHIATSSPARDAVDTGPMFDFEGDNRPRGVRFDIGADEAP